MALNEQFRLAIAKEFGIDPDNLKQASIMLGTMTAPKILLTVQLTASQVKALHWIDEAGD